MVCVCRCRGEWWRKEWMNQMVPAAPFQGLESTLLFYPGTNHIIMRVYDINKGPPRAAAVTVFQLGNCQSPKHKSLGIQLGLMRNNGNWALALILSRHIVYTQQNCVEWWMTDLEVLTLKLQCPSTLASGPVFHGWSQVLPSLGSFLINSATSPMTFFVTKFISAAFWVHTLSLSAWLFSDSFICIRHVSLQIDNKLRSRNPVTFFVERAHSI